MPIAEYIVLDILMDAYGRKLNNFMSEPTITESDARSTGVQLKSAVKIITLIGLITKHVDFRMTFKC